MKLTQLVILSFVVLGGCSLFADRNSDSPVRLREKLEIPPDLSRSSMEDLSNLPTSASAKNPGTQSAPAAAPTAPKSVGVPAASLARLEREGTQRWLVVQATPDYVWAVLRDFLHRTRGGLTAENIQLGYIETDWVEQRYNLGQSAIGRALASMQSTGMRDKFRVRIESGRQPGTTEVMVSHIGLEQVSVGAGIIGPDTVWQPRKSDPVLEADLLDRMLIALGAVDPTTRPVLTTEQPAVKRAARPKGPLVLAGETSDSAWRKVSQALDREGIVIEDRDRGSGLLYVRYQQQDAKEEKSGITTWLFGNRKKTEADDGQGRYQLRLKSDKNGVVVDVLNVEGKVDTLDPVPPRLLDLLYQQLF